MLTIYHIKVINKKFGENGSYNFEIAADKIATKYDHSCFTGITEF